MALAATRIVPGTLVPQEGVIGNASPGILDMAVTSVDEVLDSVLGMRPLRHIARPLAAIMPANIIKNVTGLAKPSEIIEEFEDKLEQKIQGMKTGGPRLPRF